MGVRGPAPTLTRLDTAVGYDRDEIKLEVITYEQMRPGSFSVPDRLADMDVNHVQSALCFPTFPRFCGQTFTEAKDRELGLLGVRAYNDWMVEEWCGPEANGRLIPLTLIPLWDARLAAAEVRRNAARGVRAVAFSEIPPHLGLPSIHTDEWDPFLEACNETGTVIAMHIGSSSRMPSTSADAPLGRRLHHHLRQLLLLDGGLADERQVREVPQPQDHVRGGPDRLDPVHP